MYTGICETAYLPACIQLIKAHPADRTDRHAIGGIQHALFAVLITHMFLPTVLAKVNVVYNVDECASSLASVVWIW